MNISKETMYTTLERYTVYTQQDHAYFEHFFDLGPYGKGFMSPLEHIAILTWHKMRMNDSGDHPLLIKNEKGGPVNFIHISCTNPNDFDLLKQLSGGYTIVDSGGFPARWRLGSYENGSPLSYHDTVPFMELIKFCDEWVWMMVPIFCPSGAIAIPGTEIVRDERKLLK